MDETICVLDVETTNKLVRPGERIVEVAMVLIDFEGHLVDTFETIIDPQRDVGPTHLHGLTATDVLGAPTFEDVQGDIARFLARSVLLAAHNVRFDTRFLRHEFTRCSLALPTMQTMCTMRAHGNRSLAAACAAEGIEPEGEWHSAMCDAMATVELVRCLLDSHGRDRLQTYVSSRRPKWMRLPQASGRRLPRATAAARQHRRPEYLDRLLACLPAAPKTQRPSESPPSDLPDWVESLSVCADDTPPSPNAAAEIYRTLLAEVLEDRRVDAREADDLLELAADLGLCREQVCEAHSRFLDDLVEVAWADRVLSEAEETDLAAVAHLLGFDDSHLQQRLADLRPRDADGAPVGEDVEEVVPATENVATEDLTGLSYCITGGLTCTVDGERLTKPRAAELAEAAGLIAKKSVTKSLDLLVTADANTQSQKMEKARRYDIRILQEHVFWQKLGVTVD